MTLHETYALLAHDVDSLPENRLAGGHTSDDFERLREWDEAQ